MSKKPWEKPVLIVMVRGKVEENVLTVCKTNPQSSALNKCVQEPSSGGVTKWYHQAKLYTLGNS